MFAKEIKPLANLHRRGLLLSGKIKMANYQTSMYDHARHVACMANLCYYKNIQKPKIWVLFFDFDFCFDYLKAYKPVYGRHWFSSLTSSMTSFLTSPLTQATDSGHWLGRYWLAQANQATVKKSQTPIGGAFHTVVWKDVHPSDLPNTINTIPTEKMNFQLMR